MAVQQRLVLIVVGAVLASGAALGIASLLDDPGTSVASRDAATTSAPAGDGGPATTRAPRRTTTTTVPPTTRPDGPPASSRTLSKFTTVGGDISPKSVVASGRGPVTAQNMMYRHTMTAYDGDGKLVATVPDSVRLSDFGIDKPGVYKGAPVEAAFMHSSDHVYISNYAMYGPGFVEGKDSCSPASGVTNSFLYRISTRSWKVDQVVPVGATPKYVAVTPDDQRVLTSNWCTYDLSVSSTKDGKELQRIKLGPYPRGIAVSPDGRFAYVAVMGSTRVAKIDLGTYAVSWFNGVGLGPRHLVLSPDGKFLYATLNKEGSVVKIDTATGTVVRRVRTGQQPRSMAISTDGTAVYVVNYESSTMSKLATSDMHQVQSVPTGHHPIGIAYDGATGRVWVANYSGTIFVFDEK